MSERTLSLPPPLVTATYSLRAADRRVVILDNPARIKAEHVDNDLVFARDDGSRLVLRDFFVNDGCPRPRVLLGGQETQLRYL